MNCLSIIEGLNATTAAGGHQLHKQRLTIKAFIAFHQLSCHSHSLYKQVMSI